MALADPKCPKCSGSGVVSTFPGEVRECECKLRARAVEYLTPRYAKAMFLRKMQTANLTQDLVFHANVQGCPMATLVQTQHSVIKSYLLNTGMKYRHYTMDGLDELIQAWVTDGVKEHYAFLHGVQFLIIILGSDPPNSRYFELITSLCDKRRSAGLMTWITTPYNYRDAIISMRYGEGLAAYLKTHFEIMKTDLVMDQSIKRTRPQAVA